MLSKQIKRIEINKEKSIYSSTAILKALGPVRTLGMKFSTLCGLKLIPVWQYKTILEDSRGIHYICTEE